MKEIVRQRERRNKRELRYVDKVPLRQFGEALAENPQGGGARIYRVDAATLPRQEQRVPASTAAGI